MCVRAVVLSLVRRAGGPVFSPSLPLAGSSLSRYWLSSFPSSARRLLPGGERDGRRRKRERLTQFLVCCIVDYGVVVCA